MYNLFISGHEEAWNGEPYLFETARCVSEFMEFTDTKLTKRFGELDAAAISELQRLPCIFAYEQHGGWKPPKFVGKPPKFGIIHNITKRRGKVRIEYKIEKIEPFLSVDDLSELAFALDIPGAELCWTHWAVKDVNLSKELRVKGISLPNWARNVSKAVDITTHAFEVALSFPGEVRSFVETIAAELEKNMGPDSYFYDNNYVSQLARPSLDVLLQDIYRNRSKLVVVFLCGDYQHKEWCGVEFRAIQEIMMERNNEKIFLVKMDDGSVDGVFKTDGYVDGRRHSPEDIARLSKNVSNC
jgi:hypothetical protein